MQDAAEAEQRELETRIAAEGARSASLKAEILNLEKEIASLQARAEEAQGPTEDVGDGLAPAEAEAQASRLALRQLLAERDQLRRRRGELESSLTEARIASTRAEQRVERLYDQLRSDAEWLGLETEEQLELGASLEVELDRVEALPEDIEPRLDGLRRRMRAIGNIDRDALEAYEETHERHRVLGEEEADLVAAERDLRGLLDSLNDEMGERFEKTFTEVAEAFADFFPMLFGGGEAQLVLEGDEDDGPANMGLEIMARPPGKRLQPLSLLSGGERALTGVALIFALLRVSRTPFVVLDEVDAALDEANVDRFCRALDRLAEDIQVVVITHNRGTIQTAGTVYGVTMAEDGASQIISLNVDAIA